MPVNKNDDHARAYWGGAYDAIPKSVFASLCWHLANLASGEADAPLAAEGRTVEEIRALAAVAILPAAQARTSLAAIEREAPGATAWADRGAAG